MTRRRSHPGPRLPQRGYCPYCGGVKPIMRGRDRRTSCGHRNMEEGPSCLDCYLDARRYSGSSPGAGSVIGRDGAETASTIPGARAAYGVQGATGDGGVPAICNGGVASPMRAEEGNG